MLHVILYNRQSKDVVKVLENELGTKIQKSKSFVLTVRIFTLSSTPKCSGLLVTVILRYFGFIWCFCKNIPCLSLLSYTFAFFFCFQIRCTLYFHPLSCVSSLPSPSYSHVIIIRMHPATPSVFVLCFMAHFFLLLHIYGVLYYEFFWNDVGGWVTV